MFGRKSPDYILLGGQTHSTRQNKKKNCKLCGKRLITISRLIIHNHYFEAFNFYFAKPVNEVLANVPHTSHIIWFKDISIWDDEGEYLKRFYNKEELKPRIDILTEFYKLSYKPVHPNLLVTDCNRLMSKRFQKQDKIFYQILNKENKKQEEEQKQQPDIVMNKILYSNFDYGTQPDSTDESQNRFVQPKISYETEDHDIYSQQTSEIKQYKKSIHTINLKGLQILDNIEIVNQSQTNWTNQEDHDLSNVIQNINVNSVGFQIEKLKSDQKYIEIFLKRPPTINKQTPIISTEGNAELDLVSMRRQSEIYNAKESKKRNQSEKKSQIPIRKLDVAQGFQGSQNSIKNVSASSLHQTNQNGIMQFFFQKSNSSTIVLRLNDIDSKVYTKGCLTDRIVLRSPETTQKSSSLVKQQYTQNTINNLINNSTKSKLDQVQFSNQDVVKTFTEDLLMKIQDLQLQTKKNAQVIKASNIQRIAQMPQKYMIQSQYNTVQTNKTHKPQQTSSTSRQVDKNTDPRSQESLQEKLQIISKDKVFYRSLNSGYLQKSQNGSKKENSRQQNNPSNSQIAEDHPPLSPINLKPNSAKNATQPKKFDFKLNLANLKKDGLRELVEEVCDEQNQRSLFLILIQYFTEQQSYLTQRVQQTVLKFDPKIFTDRYIELKLPQQRGIHLDSQKQTKQSQSQALCFKKKAN